MNKKLLIGALVLSMAPMLASADKGPGCGVGAMIFEGQSGVIPNILAATTNGSFGNQTFGMTSGTLGCDTSGNISAAANDYLDSNMERVARDLATGQGESIETLAALMGIQAADKQRFFQVSQQNFSTIFSSDKATSNDVMSALQKVMASDKQLSKYVS